VSTSALKSVYLEALSWRFVLGCIFSIGATIWFPLVQITMTDSEGNEIGSRYVPMYEIYWNLIQDPTHLRGWYYVGLHIGIIVFVSYWVWVAVLRTRRQVNAPVPAQPKPEPAPDDANAD